MKVLCVIRLHRWAYYSNGEITIRTCDRCQHRQQLHYEPHPFTIFTAVKRWVDTPIHRQKQLKIANISRWISLPRKRTMPEKKLSMMEQLLVQTAAQKKLLSEYKTLVNNMRSQMLNSVTWSTQHEVEFERIKQKSVEVHHGKR